jgi:oligoendopeptidase F
MIMPFTPASPIVPADLDASRWDSVKPIYDELIGRELHCVKCLERLLMDRSELDAAVSEAASILYIRMTCQTDDAAATAAYTEFVEHAEPELRRAGFALDRKIVESPYAKDLDPRRYEVMLRNLKADVSIFREQNIPLGTRLTMLAQEYSKISGAMTLEFDGREQTLTQMGRYNDETDRSLRERAWRAAAERRARDADAIDAIYESMLPLRQQIAGNAGFANYRDYAFVSKRRFDYTPQMCHDFARGIERHVTPLARRLIAERRAAMGIDAVRPWDVAVDVKGRPPLRPFKTADELVAKCRRVFDRMDPDLAAMFAYMATEQPGPTVGGLPRSLDLDSRKGKAPGGYQSSRERIRKPFIFMNAAGVQRDVDTLVHEAGHAFHTLLCRGESLLHYRSELPLEFAEVASMSMELLSHPYLDEFYTPDEAARARRNHLEGVLRGLVTIAIVDQFQHWVHENPGHSRAERHDRWVELQQRLGLGLDYSGFEHLRRTEWHRILHLFEMPFYYIEYGIAQLGALQVWLNAGLDRAGALGAYKRALTLGASRPLPELFAAAGTRFDLGPDTIGRLTRRVEDELASIPA